MSCMSSHHFDFTSSHARARRHRQRGGPRLASWQLYIYIAGRVGSVAALASVGGLSVLRATAQPFSMPEYLSPTSFAAEEPELNGAACAALDRARANFLIFFSALCLFWL